MTGADEIIELLNRSQVSPSNLVKAMQDYIRGRRIRFCERFLQAIEKKGDEYHSNVELVRKELDVFMKTMEVVVKKFENILESVLDRENIGWGELGGSGFGAGKDKFKKSMGEKAQGGAGWITSEKLVTSMKQTVEKIDKWLKPAGHSASDVFSLLRGTKAEGLYQFMLELGIIKG